MISLVLDANDNKPSFEQESYSAIVSEAALPGQYITTITAKDVDSGSFGDAGIRYSLSGTGAELFHVNDQTGVITLADCQPQSNRRLRRDLHENDSDAHTLEMLSMHSNPNSELREINTEPTVQYTLIAQSPLQPEIAAPPPPSTANDDKASSSNATPTCLDYETETTYFLSYKVSV